MISRGYLNRIPQKTLVRVSRYSLALILALALLLGIAGNVMAAQPVVTPESLSTWQVNVTYSHAFLSSAISGTATWEMNGTVPGLSLNPSTGVLSGIPTTTGSYQFYIRVTDSAELTNPTSNWQLFSLTINPPPFSITTTTVPDGKEASAYSITLTVSGGATPYTWSIVSGTLPSGLALSSSGGYISGTPAKGSTGTYSFTIQVADNSSPQLTAQKSFTIYIEKGIFQPTISIDTGLQAGYTKVKANNAQVTSLTGGESYTLTLDLGATRTITVDATVEHPSDNGVRFKAVEDTQIVSETQPSVVFSYYTEYKIDIITSPTGIATLSGSGWYEKDSDINLTAKEDISANDDTSYKFSHWQLPDNQQISSETLNYTVIAPDTITAVYETYYKLTITSEYGETEGGGFYKAGTQATWSVVNDKVPMEGALGFFQGKYKAIIPHGTVTMNEPKTVKVNWKADYTLPYVLIPLVIIVIALALFGLYLLLKRAKPTPAPVPYGAPYPGAAPFGPRPIPQQHTTVVMIGDQGDRAKQLPGTTKQQLVEKFAQLLDTYEAEIKSSMGIKETPQIKGTDDKMLSAPEPSEVMEAEVVKDVSICGASTKKLLRTVAGKWRQVESSTIALAADEQKTEESIGLSVTWARDIYHEWEITNCTLPINHKGKHRGDTRIVFSPLNTVTFKQSYNPEQKVEPPSPHFTDSMPEEEPDENSIIDAEELPSQTI